MKTNFILRRPFQNKTEEIKYFRLKKFDLDKQVEIRQENISTKNAWEPIHLDAVECADGL